MLDSALTSTWGRGLDLSLRSARLPLLHQALYEEVRLYVVLPGRARMFRARGHVARATKALVVRFDEVSPDDMTLLAHCLIQTAGLCAVPQLDVKFQRLTELNSRFWSASTEPAQKV